MFTASHASSRLWTRCLMVHCCKSLRELYQNTVSTTLLTTVCNNYGMPIISVGIATQYFAGQALVAEHSLKLPNLFREQYLNKPPPCLVHHVGHNVFAQLPILLVFVVIPGRNVCFGKVGAPVFHYISLHHCWLQKQVSAQVTFLCYLVQQ